MFKRNVTDITKRFGFYSPHASCFLHSQSPVDVRHHAVEPLRRSRTHSNYFLLSSGFDFSPSHHIPLRYRMCSFSTLTQPILVRARDPSRVVAELIDMVDQRRLDAAWKLYELYVGMDDEFPRKSVVTKLVIGLMETYDPCWLDKAYQVVESCFEWRKNGLEKGCMTYVSYVLARCGMYVAAGNILRRLVEAEEYPHIKVWLGIISHMCQTREGSFLAADILSEFGSRFNDNRVDTRKKSNRPLLLMKPNAEAFSMVLTSCFLSGMTNKAEELLELIPRVGVKIDIGLLIVMGHVYEKNGRIEEIKKLKRFVDEDCGVSGLQLQQFYHCLISCHMKLRDLESTTGIVLEMLRKAKEAKSSLCAAKSIIDAVQKGKVIPTHQVPEHEKSRSSDKLKQFIHQPPSFEEFCKDGDFSKISYEAKELLQRLQDGLQARAELVKSDHGILHPSEKIYAKLVGSYIEAEKMGDLAIFLINASKLDTPVSNDESVVVQVINACISLQFLDQAHALLDEMRFHGVKTGSSVYSSLLKAYCKERRLGEVTMLLKDARKAGVQLDSSCYEALIQSHAHQKDIVAALALFKEMNASNISKSNHHEFEMLVEESVRSRESSLTAKLLEEIKDFRELDCGVHDWNNVIHFFCKKRMMQDAQKALNRMRVSGHIPNSQTFHSLVTAYAAIGGKYTEVTDLWGEMKLMAGKSSLKFDQEILDSLLYCFVRGGFFLRANEVVLMMEKGGMFIDKYKYRTLWLKYHRTLYKGKVSKVQTEAQCERREAALSFKKWLNLT